MRSCALLLDEDKQRDVAELSAAAEVRELDDAGSLDHLGADAVCRCCIIERQQ